FFMHKLQERIAILAESGGSMFCRKVLQINFNSWHYSDANLWASLTTKIFEELEKYGENSPGALYQLFEGLDSTKELIAETAGKKLLVDRQITALEEKKKVFDDKVKRDAE